MEVSDDWTWKFRWQLVDLSQFRVRRAKAFSLVGANVFRNTVFFRSASDQPSQRFCESLSYFNIF